MGTPKKPIAVKLVIGFIFKDAKIYVKAKSMLKIRFGLIDFESQILDFVHTDYYEKEFGKNLKRGFVSFQKLISPDQLSAIKITTNKIEAGLSLRQLRRINIDPGYLDLSKLVLATTKPYRHRIYLCQGIWAEVTLFYQGNTFRPWEWTYPDYQTEVYISIFDNIRKIYVEQVKKI
jgi:hypothetical protein